jgi:hypothetical protein
MRLALFHHINRYGVWDDLRTLERPYQGKHETWPQAWRRILSQARIIKPRPGEIAERLYGDAKATQERKS